MMQLKDKLKKGQAFIGLDNNKYYFLGYDYEEQIMFTSLDFWTDKEKKYIVKSNTFIKEILDETSELIEDSSWYYQSLNELEISTTEEKIKRCLDIIKNENISNFELCPIEIGPLVSGQAYSKKFEQYYKLIGFIVDNNVYLDGKFNGKQKGFFAIYHSNCDEQVPLIFERSTAEDSFYSNSFIAGNDDTIDIQETLLPKDLVNANISNNLKERLETINNTDREF